MKGKRAIRATAEVACSACKQPIKIGDLFVYWGWGRTSPRHFRCVESNREPK